MRISTAPVRPWARFGPIAVIAAVTIVVLAMGWHRQITLENVVMFRDRFHDLLAHHGFLALLAFVCVYIVVAALSIPCGFILTTTGGLLFGWLQGGIAAVLGATTGATIVFLLARSALGESLSKQAAPWLDKLRRGFKDEALSYLLFLRLVPAFPFWFVNIAPAILGVPLRTYVVATFLGIIPATMAFASIGAGLDSIVATAKAEYVACLAAGGADACKLTINASSLVTKELMLAFVLLGLAALIPVAFKRWRHSHAAAK
ncbi:MAG: TVP38/TMEM64 family protein [Hyphomicrobiaceae bacterium]|nr:MAG: TVP38/TMEM64 family protein [Hyphomicrobiaceae bacterium]